MGADCCGGDHPGGYDVNTELQQSTTEYHHLNNGQMLQSNIEQYDDEYTEGPEAYRTEMDERTYLMEQIRVTLN